MKNFVQPGKELDIVAPSGGIVSGKIVIINSLIGVANVTRAQGEEGTISTEGVFRYAKTTGQSWNLGAKIYYDSATDKLTTSNSSTTLVGLVAKAAASADTEGLFKIGTPV